MHLFSLRKSNVLILILLFLPTEFLRAFAGPSHTRGRVEISEPEERHVISRLFGNPPLFGTPHHLEPLSLTLGKDETGNTALQVAFGNIDTLI